MTDTRHCFFFVAHRLDGFVFSQINLVRAELPQNTDFFVIAQEEKAAPFTASLGSKCVLALPKSEIFYKEYYEKAAGGRLIPGNPDLLSLAAWRSMPRYKRVWIAEYDVYVSGGWRWLFELASNSEADLLACHVRTRSGDKSWAHWDSLSAGSAPLPDHQKAAFLPLMRLSREALSTLDEFYRLGWSGHFEATIPTACAAKNLRVVDFNALSGEKAYLPSTFGVRKPTYNGIRQIYHPIKSFSAVEELFAPAAHPNHTTAEAISRISTPSMQIGDPHLSAAERPLMEKAFSAGCRRYLEFGLGGSTLLAIRRGAEAVVAIDSDRSWVEEVRAHPEIAPRIGDRSVSVLHADLGPIGQWGMPQNREPLASWPDYVKLPWAEWGVRGTLPDLVYVDGRFRVACCLSVVVACGRPHEAATRVLLHDVCAQRPYYNEIFEFFETVERVNSLYLLRMRPDACVVSAMARMLEYQFDPR